MADLVSLGTFFGPGTPDPDLFRFVLVSNFSKVEKLTNSLSKIGRFRTSGSTFCSRRTRGRFDSDLNGRLASPDYEPPFSNAKPGISCVFFDIFVKKC